MTTPDAASSHPESRLGCGRFSRETLEIAAVARVDRSVAADIHFLGHLPECPACVAAVSRLYDEHRLLVELAGASMPSPAERTAMRGVDEAPIPGYRLGEELHRGGQGVVYAAEQLATRRPCAVKMLLGGRFALPAQRTRFEREIEVVAALRHPSIVTLYESGISSAGEPWFAMEFVDGQRLDEFTARARLSVDDALRLFRAVADAVAYAHRRGVIHRDLKPGNILVDRDGVPRILDFGLARTDEAAESVASPGTTRVGEFLGTFAYAAPEQLAGDPALIDSRCDLYALGVVMYECLAGVRPFEGARSLGDLIAQKTSGSVRRLAAAAASQGRKIDADLDVIVMRLLSPDPARRYESAAALAEDLARRLDGRPVLARNDSLSYVALKTLRRHWVASGFIGAFILAMVGAGIALGIAYNRAESERVRAEAERARVERAYRSFRDALESADPELGRGSSEMLVAEYLKAVEAQVQQELGSEPELLAEILQTLGVVHLGYEDIEGARTAIETAFRVLSEGYKAGRVSDAQQGTATIAMAKLQFARKEYPLSEQFYRVAVLHFTTAHGADSIPATDALRQQASAVRAQRRFEDAAILLDDALRRSERFESSREAAIARAAILNGRAVLASARGNDLEAVGEFEAALDAIRPFVPNDDFRVGRTLFSLARVEQRLGRLLEAEMHAREAIEILRHRKGEAARSTVAARELLAAIEKSIDEQGRRGGSEAR